MSIVNPPVVLLQPPARLLIGSGALTVPSPPLQLLSGARVTGAAILPAPLGLAAPAQLGRAVALAHAVDPAARFISVPAEVPMPGVSVVVLGGVAGAPLVLLQEASFPSPVPAALPGDFRYTVVSCDGSRARPDKYCEECAYKGFVRKGTGTGGARWRDPKEHREISALEAAARSAAALAQYGRVYMDTVSTQLNTVSAELGGVETGARPKQMGRGAVTSSPQRGSMAQALG